MVRAGAHGEREEAARQDGKAYIGWAEMGDLAGLQNIGDVRKRVDEFYPEESAQTRGNWAGQLYRFCVEMEKGDIIVTPLKNSPDDLLIGRVTSDYLYDPDADVDFRHHRKVAWKGSPLDRGALRHDLRASIGSLLTVAKLERNDAYTRLEKLSNGASRDEYGPTGKYATLEDLAKAFSEGGSVAEMQIPVHELLYLAGIQRRTAGTLASLENRLDGLGLAVSETISDLNLDDPVVVRAVGAIASPSRDTPKQPESKAAKRAIGYRVSAVPSSTTRPAFVSTGDTLELAMTRMLQDNYSQLPVLDDGALKGAVTWESIALAKIHKVPEKVADAILPSPHIVSLDTDLLEVVDLVNSRGFILVSGQEDSIGGIITVEDLVKEFGRDRYPLVLLEEIELRLRDAVSRRCTDDDIKKSATKADSLSRLTMGNYTYLLQDDNIWTKLAWSGVDRGILTDLVERCRVLRNELMHYSPDPINEKALADIEGALRVIRTLTPEL